MSNQINYEVIEEIQCYSPNVAYDYSDYPDDGFELTDENLTSWWVGARNRLFKFLVLKNLNKNKTTQLLEVGCGVGDFIKHLSSEEKLEITGSEIYIKGLKYAKRKLPDINFIQLDIAQGRIDKYYDLIISFDVLEHIEDDLAAISNIESMLKKDGTLILSVPQHQFMWSSIDDIVKHKRRYSKKDLINKLNKNGLEVEYSTSFVFTLFPLMLIYRLLENKRNINNSDKIELKKKVSFSNITNILCNAIMKFDEFLIKLGISLPFGGTLIVIAKKKNV
jgi:SAM-dependent methyltransferase